MCASRHAYNGDDELTSQTNSVSGTTTNSYDANGSLTSSVSSSGTSTYSYDVRNKMVGYTGGGTAATYVYDDAGNRVAETVNGVTSYYLTDTQNPTGYAQPIEVHVGSPTAAPTTTYVLGDRTLGQADNSGAVSYPLIDGHGSTQALTNAMGVVTSTFNYDAFGTAIGFDPATTPIVNLFGGDAIYEPVSGLYLHGDGTRDRLGFQFIQADTRGNGNDYDPLSFHLYLYANGNPVNGWDQSGHEEEEVLEATSLGEWLDAAFSRGIQVVSRIARPLIGLLSAGAGWLVGQGQNALEFLRYEGTAGIAYIQQAFLHQQEIVSQEEAESGPVWNSFQAAKNYLNDLITGGEDNPQGIQWHHLVNQASNFSGQLLNSAVNLVPTPTPIHQAISGFLASRSDWLPEGFAKVQDFVTTLDCEEQYEIGLKIWQSAMYAGTRDDFAEIVKGFVR